LYIIGSAANSKYCHFLSGGSTLCSYVDMKGCRGAVPSAISVGKRKKIIMEGGRKLTMEGT
jgi:hypothetical protein